MNNQPSATVFKFRDGYCRIFQHQIVFSTSDTIAENDTILDKPAPVSSMSYVITIFSVLLVGFGIYGYFKNFYFESGFVAICGIALFIHGYRKMILSYTPVIERDRIVKVSFRHGVPGQTASRFIILFKDNNDRLQERRIILTNRPDFGDENARAAIAMMNRHFDVKGIM